MFTTHWCLPSVRSRLLLYDGIKYLPKATWRIKEFIWLPGYSPAPRKQGRSLGRDYRNEMGEDSHSHFGPHLPLFFSLSFSFLSHPSSHPKLSVLKLFYRVKK